jgi:hypothetical protein
MQGIPPTLHHPYLKMRRNIFHFGHLLRCGGQSDVFLAKK